MNQRTPRYVPLQTDKIGRISDLPYWTSPPAQFSVSQTAALSVGEYIFSSGRQEMTNIKNLNESTVLYIYDISFSADISVLDYQESLQLAAGGTDIPKFSMFMQSDRNSPILQDPILCQNYFDQQPYQLLLEPKITPNTLSAFFRGKLNQTGALAGVNEITLTMTLYVQQISDDNFIQQLKNGYPEPSGYA